MSQYALWVCNRCGGTERSAAGDRPGYWGTVTRERFDKVRYPGPGSADLCWDCWVALDHFMRNEGEK